MDSTKLRAALRAIRTAEEKLEEAHNAVSACMRDEVPAVTKSTKKDPPAAEPAQVQDDD